MLDATAITSITDFARRYQAMYRALKKSGKPHVLTINGKAAMVVQDAQAYQRMMELLDGQYVRAMVEEAENDPRPSLSDAESRAAIARLRKRWRASKRKAG